MVSINLDKITLNEIIRDLVRRLEKKNSHIYTDKEIEVNISTIDITDKQGGILAVTVSYADNPHNIRTYVYYAGAGHTKEDAFALFNRLSETSREYSEKIPINVTNHFG